MTEQGERMGERMMGGGNTKEGEGGDCNPNGKHDTRLVEWLYAGRLDA